MAKAVLVEDVLVAKAVRAAKAVQAAGVPVVPDHKAEVRKANAHDVRLTLHDRVRNQRRKFHSGS